MQTEFCVPVLMAVSLQLAWDYLSLICRSEELGRQDASRAQAPSGNGPRLEEIKA
jgi:hypothetical protein